MQVIPVNFSTEHREMLGHAKMLMESGMVAINPAFDKLVTALRTAIENQVYFIASWSFDIIELPYDIGIKVLLSFVMSNQMAIQYISINIYTTSLSKRRSSSRIY